MKVLFPVLAGFFIGVFHIAMGINGVAMLFGVVVLIGVLNDNLSQAMQITALAAVATMFIDSTLILYLLGALLAGAVLQKIVKLTSTDTNLM